MGCKILQYLYILHRQCRSCTDPLVFPKRTYQVRLSRGYNLCLSVCLMIIISVTVRISNRLCYSCWDGKVSATLNLVVHTKSEHFTIVGQHNNTYELCQQLLDVMTCPDRCHLARGEVSMGGVFAKYKQFPLLVDHTGCS